MAKKLEIPYRSQRDSDALYAPSDCGAACVAMLLQAYGMQVSIDDVFKATGEAQQNFLSRGDLIRAARQFHLDLSRFGNGDQAFLQARIDESKPFIALVNYQAWSKPNSGVSTQSSFAKTHFVVVTGYDGNDVMLNDPLWWGARRQEGKNKQMTYTQFEDAWGSCHLFLNNPDFVGLVVDDPLPGVVQPPAAEPVTQEEINRILAWGAFKDILIEEDRLTIREVADVYLTFVGTWGTNVIDHTVRDGEDLGILALRYYGNPMKWKVITLFNDLPPIDAFQVGDVLKIPEPTLGI
jgi:predicted double-glycine peptidase